MPFHISTSFFEYEIKKSRFLAYARKIDGAEEFKCWRQGLKEKSPDARHWVSCCMQGAISNPKFVLLDDDGEPSGTAAKPILNVISHKDLCDVGVVIVRYFGGIKLGAGGLARAYGAAAAGAIDAAQKTLVVEMLKKSISVEFEKESHVRRAFDELGVGYSAEYTGNGVDFLFSVTSEQWKKLESLEILSY